MNFKKNWKRFWTLSSAREGFTLVELIVVIAILAILAGVAVPAYSGYVKKANMQADMTLASEVAHALTLYYYSHPDEVVSGYVVLSTSGASGDGVVGDAAMAAVFGANWADTAVLKYDGWTDSATLLGEVAGNKYASSVNGSTYVNQVGTDALLGDVQQCASKLAEFLVGIGWSGEESAKALNGLLGGDAAALPDVLVGYEGDITADVLANAAVFGIGANMSDSDVEDIRSNFNSGDYILRNWQYASSNGVTTGPALTMDNYPDNILTETASTYAALEGLVGYLGNDDINAIFNSIPLDGSAPHIIGGISDACNDILNTAFADPNLTAKVLEYYNCTSFDDLGKTSSSLAMTDGEAYCAIMQTVNNLDSDYADSLTDTNLFGSQDMANRVNDYITAASMTGSIDATTLNKIVNGEYGSAIIIMLSAEKGSPECAILPNVLVG